MACRPRGRSGRGAPDRRAARRQRRFRARRCADWSACGRGRRRKSRSWSAIAHGGSVIAVPIGRRLCRARAATATVLDRSAERGRQSPRPDPRRRGRARTGAPPRRAATPRPRRPRTARMPCASSPSTIPASTSPEPAVASCGGAFSLIAARPSGAAITVSAPLSSTTAPLSRAARRARSSLPACSPARVEQAGKLALMRGHHARRADRREQRLRDLRQTTVSASASSTARLPRGEDRQRLVAGLAADAGARADQRRVAPRVGEQLAERRRSPQPGCTMTPVSAAA